jgi:protocatechuate 3,4-dioxygenase beta subunit
VGGVGLLLAACGRSGSNSSASTSTTGATSTTAGAGSSSTVTAIPEETGGPFPADGSNGPDVLAQNGIVRRDIRSSFGQYSGTAVGVPLGVALTIVEAGSGEPIDGATVYLWHCDRDG